MKKQAFIFFVAILASLSLRAQVCTPDTSIKDVGMYPRTLPDAMVGANYNETIQFKFPKDTSYNSTKVPIDSVRVYEVKNMPSGFTYQCNASNCTYAGGSNGCVTLYGKPTSSQAGDYSIKITALVKVKFGGAGFWVPYVDSLPFSVKDGSGIFDRPAAQAAFFVKTNYPNPFTQETNIPFNSPSSETVVFKVYDILGSVVFSKAIHAQAGENTLQLERAGLPSGLYLYSLQLGSQVIAQQMMIKD